MNTTPVLAAEYKKVITARYNKTCHTCGGNVIADQDFAALNHQGAWHSYCAKCGRTHINQIAGLVARIEALVAPLGDNVPVEITQVVAQATPGIEAVFGGDNSTFVATKSLLLGVLTLATHATATPDPLIDALKAIAAGNDRDSNFARSLLAGHAKYGSLTAAQRNAAESMIAGRARKAAQAPAAYAPLPTVEVGLYRDDDGTIRRVYRTSRQRLGCRKYNGRNFLREGNTGVRLVADGLAAGTVRLLTAAEASAFGRQIGRCFNCMSLGRPGDLSDDRSLAVGYGEICANHNGWWYPTNDEAARILRGDLDLDQKLTQGLPLAPVPSEGEVAAVVEALEAGDTLEGAVLDDADLYIDEDDDDDDDANPFRHIAAVAGPKQDAELGAALDDEQCIADEVNTWRRANEAPTVYSEAPTTKPARELNVGDHIHGLGTITTINTTTTPGVVYVWVNNRTHLNPADAAYHHGERVRVTGTVTVTDERQARADYDARVEHGITSTPEATVVTPEAPVCSCCGNEPATLSFVCQDGEAHKVCPPCRVMLVRRPTCPFHG